MSYLGLVGLKSPWLWRCLADLECGGVWREMRTVPGVVTTQSIPRQMVKLPFLAVVTVVYVVNVNVQGTVLESVN